MTVRELIEKLSKMHQSDDVMFNANGEWFDSVDFLIDRGDEEEMTDDTVCLFLKDEAVDIAYLQEWYIDSCNDGSWTEEQIKELDNDFICIPRKIRKCDEKDLPIAEPRKGHQR